MSAKSCQGEISATLSSMKRGNNFLFILLCAINFLALVFILIFLSPQTLLFKFHLASIDIFITILPFFFLTVFLFLFSFFSLLLKNKRRGAMIGIFFCIYLFLRLNGYNHLFFLLLLIALFVCLEFLFSQSS